MGRLREKDAHRCGIEVSCFVPQITLEMQLRKVTEIGVKNRRIVNASTGEETLIGQELTTHAERYNRVYKNHGEWTIYVRYFGDTSTLDYPKIGVLHKGYLNNKRQVPNPTYGVEGAPNADVEVIVYKERMHGEWLMHDNANSEPILFDMPANEGEWAPLMPVTEFVQQFMDDARKTFRNQNKEIGDYTKWTEVVNENFPDGRNGKTYKDKVSALFLRAGLTVVQERIFTDANTHRQRLAYTYSQPVYFTMRYAPIDERPYHIRLG